MIDLYFWPTANGRKIAFALEELNLEYRVRWVDITNGDQFCPEFFKVCPNNRIPAIVDHEGPGGCAIRMFESGAILIYLAEKTGQLLGSDPVQRYEVMQWLMWQMAGLGPMAGQASHFRKYAADRNGYAIRRYTNEVGRLYAVLDWRLATRDYICGDFSIADIAVFPWIVSHDNHGQQLGEFPALQRWFSGVGRRRASVRALELGAELRKTDLSQAAHTLLFQQSASTVRANAAGRMAASDSSTLVRNSNQDGSVPTAQAGRSHD